MSKHGKKNGPKSEEPMAAAPGQGRTARMRTRRERLRDWVGDILAQFGAGRREDVPSEMPINDLHDRAEDRPAQVRHSDVSLLKLPERVTAMEESVQRLSGLFGRVNEMERRLEELSATLPRKNPAGKVSGVEAAPSEIDVGRPRPGDQGLRERNYDDFELPALSMTPQSASRPVPARGSRGNEITIEALDQALCHALAEQTSAGLEIDSFLADLRVGMGDAPIEIEYVGQRGAGRWQIAAFLLPSNEGLAVVSPGGLADSEVSNFFEVDYGRRIFACTQPARVARNGKEIIVVRKGRVESS